MSSRQRICTLARRVVTIKYGCATDRRCVQSLNEWFSCRGEEVFCESSYRHGTKTFLQRACHTTRQYDREIEVERDALADQVTSVWGHHCHRPFPREVKTVGAYT